MRPTNIRRGMLVRDVIGVLQVVAKTRHNPATGFTYATFANGHEEEWAPDADIEVEKLTPAQERALVNVDREHVYRSWTPEKGRYWKMTGHRQALHPAPYDTLLDLRLIATVYREMSGASHTRAASLTPLGRAYLDAMTVKGT